MESLEKLGSAIGEEEEPEEETGRVSAADRQKKAAMLETAKRSGQQWSVQRTRPAQTQRSSGRQPATIAEGGKKRRRRRTRRGKGKKSRKTKNSKPGKKTGTHKSPRGQVRGIRVVQVARMPPAMSPCQMRALRGMLTAAGPGW